MKARAELRVTCASIGVRRGLGSVLSPDNEGVPPGMAFSTFHDGRAQSFVVESDTASRALSTALAVLRDLSLYEEVSLLSRPRRGGLAGTRLK